LVAWGWRPERLAECNYLFDPLSVGCEIMVEHPAAGTKNHLTKDVGVVGRLRWGIAARRGSWLKERSCHVVEP
jgi:hypothetical protein